MLLAASSGRSAASASGAAAGRAPCMLLLGLPAALQHLSTSPAVPSGDGSSAGGVGGPAAADDGPRGDRQAQPPAAGRPLPAGAAASAGAAAPHPVTAAQSALSAASQRLAPAAGGPQQPAAAGTSPTAPAASTSKAGPGTTGTISHEVPSAAVPKEVVSWQGLTFALGERGNPLQARGRRSG